MVSDKNEFQLSPMHISGNLSAIRKTETILSKSGSCNICRNIPLERVFKLMLARPIRQPISSKYTNDSIVNLKTYLKLTTTMLARTAFGKTEKYFPSASSNMVSIIQEIIDVICVFPFAEF